MQALETTISVITERRYQEKPFREFVVDFLTSGRRSKEYKKGFLLCTRYVEEFGQSINKQICLHQMGASLKIDFIEFLKDKNLMLTTIKHCVTQITTIINRAASYGYSIDASWHNETIDQEDCESIYLTRDELIKIYYFKELTRRQREIRDLFIVGCFTGLRYSDYSRLTEANVSNNRIKIKTKKTKTVVEIPMNLYVREIYERYKGFPKAPTIQQFNRMLKVIAKKIGFIESVTLERTVGHNVVTSTKQKWEMVSSHTARRSAATNMYLAGIPPIQIMTITGHKTERAFMCYIRVTKEETLRSLEGHRFFK